MLVPQQRTELLQRRELAVCARFCRELAQESTGQDALKQTKLGQGACIALEIVSQHAERHLRGDLR